MKIQGLAVVAIMILLPLSIVLDVYIGNQVKTLNLQVSYDSKLQNATYDALKTFQINSSNSDTSDIVNSKMRDIKGAANTFFNSLASNFDMSGYDQEVLREYVPALVFTMYDGYYIYAPYINKLDGGFNSVELGDHHNIGEILDVNTKYYDGQELTGLKPYVYYSCRYKKGDLDVVITYSLDNHIAVYGKKGDEIIDIHGYLLTNVNNSGIYRGISIPNNETIKENFYNQGKKYTRNVKEINGAKYYAISSLDSELNETGLEEVDYLLNGTWRVQTNLRIDTVNNNTNAIDYYKEAYEFKDKLKTYGIDQLTTSDAYTEEDERLCDVVDYIEPGEDIFKNLDSSTDGVDIEEPESNFNEHRRDIIKYSIERNLSVAISNFNQYSDLTSNDFRMPKLKDTDWDLLLNDISIISFLQGLSIGGKIYSGYSVVPNTENKEVITENSIQIVANGNVHNVTDKALKTLSESEMKGVAKKSLIKSSTENSGDGLTYYFYRYPNEDSWWYSYNSVVTQTNNENLETCKIGIKTGFNIYDYLDNFPALAKVYYTALGRERKGMYHVENDSDISDGP